jgi:hypothetical protein
MKHLIKITSFLVLSALSIGFLQSCKNKDPSVLKVFVRSASNELCKDAQVVIIGDVQSDPATVAYVDTVISNASGFALFNMDEFAELQGGKNPTGYFDIIARKDNKTGTGRVRVRGHVVTVETVFLEQ